MKMSEDFSKGIEYTTFWDEVYSEDNFNEHDILEMQKFLEAKSAPLDNPRSIELVGDFDDDLPF
jgi:hypothetical protein